MVGGGARTYRLRSEDGDSEPGGKPKPPDGKPKPSGGKPAPTPAPHVVITPAPKLRAPAPAPKPRGGNPTTVPAAASSGIVQYPAGPDVGVKHEPDDPFQQQALSSHADLELGVTHVPSGQSPPPLHGAPDLPPDVSALHFLQAVGEVAAALSQV